MLNMSEQSALQ